MHTVFALQCFVVVIHWLIFPYPSGLLHWHCGNLTIAPVPATQPWWIWINTSCEFIMNDCITTTKQSTTKPCAYFLGYTVPLHETAAWDSVWLAVSQQGVSYIIRTATYDSVLSACICWSLSCWIRLRDFDAIFAFLKVWDGAGRCNFVRGWQIPYLHHIKYYIIPYLFKKDLPIVNYLII